MKTVSLFWFPGAIANQILVYIFILLYFALALLGINVMIAYNHKDHQKVNDCIDYLDSYISLFLN